MEYYLVRCADNVEEEEDELHEDEAGHDAVDRRRVHVLVNFGALVREVQVVPA